jgi:serine/threonine-protein kinase RsbW
VEDQRSARPAPSGEAESISVTIPARPEYVAVARLAGAAVAGRMGFSYDDIEDIKVVIGEVCNGAIQAGSREVGLQFSVLPDRLVIRATHAASSGTEDDIGLGLFLIRCLVDETEIVEDGAQAQRTLTKFLTR